MGASGCQGFYDKACAVWTVSFGLKCSRHVRVTFSSPKTSKPYRIELCTITYRDGVVVTIAFP
jgi:hypothetical protein